MRSAARQEGQASVDFVATVPLLLALVAAAIQLALVGYALWCAGAAARAGSRASFVGGDARRAALSAVPEAFEAGAAVSSDGAGQVEVTVRAPSVVPGLPELPLSATAAFDPAAGP